MSAGTTRYRARCTVARAPARPLDLKRRPERLPTAEPQGVWDWFPEHEVVEGPPGNTLSDLLARCRALYGRSKTDGDDR
jgi:hypothetical protein